ncbi:hypothetical protein DL240_11575 [Lujinxingia litoralis]|uniref:Secreted protein n=1 Tax=Lujinxingia litoralis TaxID=2211119 RepID=A0A328C7D8_9DELT|nr:hypothetical protein [Lujinxingia litoralis]RAL22478.1 hypothetical protein DL240_11575 [Lujinxingia litoralis]
MSRIPIQLLTLTLALSALHLGCGPTEGPTADPVPVADDDDAGPTPDEATTDELLADAFTNVQLKRVAATHYMCECFPEDRQHDSSDACHQETAAPAADELRECFLDQLTEHPDGDQALYDFLVEVDALFDRRDACVDALDTSSCSRDILDGIRACSRTADEELELVNDAAPAAVITFMDDTGALLVNSPCRDLFSN